MQNNKLFFYAFFPVPASAGLPLWQITGSALLTCLGYTHIVDKSDFYFR